MKLKDLQGLSLVQLESMSIGSLKEAYGYQRRVLKSRFQTFRKHGLKNAIPKRYREGVPTIADVAKKGMTEEEQIRALARAVGGASGYMAGSTSTARGYMEADLALKSKLEDRLGITMTPKQYADYKNFLDTMSARMKETWKHVSAEAEEMYIQSRRLGISLDQFQKNFDYWAENIQALRKAEPKKGRKTPAAYIRELNLPKIASWKKERKKK